MPTGYQGSRAVRCTDRFVRYPYPKVLFSNYRQNYYGKLTQTEVKNHKNAFNLEKEAKIINPHKMDMGTTSSQTYKNFKVIPKKKNMKSYDDEGKPILAQSSYMKSFPNWKNGQGDIFHEK